MNDIRIFKPYPLMPCKKCGYDTGRIIPYGHFQSNQTTYRISCPKCGYCTKEKETVEEATEAWNKRKCNDELKPCPFCGAHPVREYLPDGKEYIICSNANCSCQPMTAAYKCKGTAAREWNRRMKNDS